MIGQKKNLYTHHTSHTHKHHALYTPHIPTNTPHPAPHTPPQAPHIPTITTDTVHPTSTPHTTPQHMLRCTKDSYIAVISTSDKRPLIVVEKLPSSKFPLNTIYWKEYYLHNIEQISTSNS